MRQGTHALKLKLSLIFICLLVPNTIDLLGNFYFMLTLLFITSTVNIGGEHNS